MKPRSRRGDVEIQFNWIFVMIAGALIIILFISIAMKQRAIAQEKLFAEVIDKLSLILTGAQTTPGLAKHIEVPDMGYTFNCDLDTCNGYVCSSFMSAGSAKAAKFSYPVQPIYSPDILKGNSLGTWTLELDVPFRAANMLYITSPSIRYIFVMPQDGLADKPADSQNGAGQNVARQISYLADELFRTMPESIRDPATGVETKIVLKEAVTSEEQIVGTGHYKTKIILVASDTPNINSNRDVNSNINTNTNVDLKSFDNTDLTILTIVPEQDSIDGYGILSFQKRNKKDIVGSLQSSEYFGKSMLFAAIFSEDWETYECNSRKAAYRMRIISQVYEKRTEKLSEFFGSQGQINNCPRPDVYEKAKVQFRKVTEAAGKIERGESGWAQDLAGIQADLERLNNIALAASCPALY